MKSLTLLPLLVATLATPAIATAQEQAPANDVSTLNGQLVPVGEHNEYRYSYKRVNIAMNPLGVATGMYSLGATVALAPNVAVRGSATLYEDLYDSGAGGVGFTLGVPLYFRKMYTGFFLEPMISVRSIGETDAAGPGVVAGWHFIWDSGFNVAFALGASRNLEGSSESFDKTLPEGYLHAGFAF